MRGMGCGCLRCAGGRYTRSGAGRTQVAARATVEHEYEKRSRVRAGARDVLSGWSCCLGVCGCLVGGGGSRVHLLVKREPWHFNRQLARRKRALTFNGSSRWGARPDRPPARVARAQSTQF